MPEREPLPIILLMTVTNPKAPRAGEVGTVVQVLREADGTQEMIWLRLRFADGEERAYDRGELELCLP